MRPNCTHLIVKLKMMRSSTAFFLFIFSLFLVDHVTAKTHVRIMDGLPGRVELTVHCKSKDDDLGVHSFTDYYEFSFDPSFFETTQYFCSFSWAQNFHWFDIYIGKRDSTLCFDQCWWNATESGPCMLDPKDTRYIIKCYPWNVNAVKRPLNK